MSELNDDDDNDDWRSLCRKCG